MLCGGGARRSMLAAAPGGGERHHLCAERPGPRQRVRGAVEHLAGGPDGGRARTRAPISPDLHAGRQPKRRWAASTSPTSRSTRRTGGRALPERRRRDAGAARRLLLEPRREPRDGHARARSRHGSSLPMSPYYFPDVVRNPDGSLTGYFDYRPEGRRRGDHRRAVNRQRQELDHRGRGARAEPGLLPDGGHQRRRPGPPVRDVGRRHAPTLYTLQRPAGDYDRRGAARPPRRTPAVRPAGGAARERTGRRRPEHLRDRRSRSADQRRGEHPGLDARQRGLARADRRRPLRGLQRAASPSSSVITCTGTSTGAGSS